MIRKLLLVDDDPDDTELFQEAIDSIDLDIELHIAQNCKEILPKLKTGYMLPEIIFLDINMPDMNGYECLAVLKSDQLLKDIPVVMYSTSSVNHDGKKALNKGAICFFEKPASFAKLKDFLTQIIQAERPNLDEQLRRIEASKLHRLLVA